MDALPVRWDPFFFFFVSSPPFQLPHFGSSISLYCLLVEGEFVSAFFISRDQLSQRLKILKILKIAQVDSSPRNSKTIVCLDIKVSSGSSSQSSFIYVIPLFLSFFHPTNSFHGTLFCLSPGPTSNRSRPSS